MTSRRRFLRGVVAGSLVSLALPRLRAHAACGVLPKRFGLFFWGNGMLPELWTPTGEGADFTLSEQLMPLAGHQGKICVVTGTNVMVPNAIAHSSGAAGILTGAPLLIEGSDDTVMSPTIDQVIAGKVGGETVYRSIQTTVDPSQGGWSYSGPNSRNPPESSPFAFYERLFGETFREPGEEGQVDPSLGLRRSVLDAVVEDADELYTQLGQEDRERLEHHLDGIRDLEKRLAKLEEDPPELKACARPSSPEAEYPDIDGRPQLALKNQIMAELIAMALACDQTRVFAHFFSSPVADLLYPGMSAGHHALTHDEPDPQPEVNAITTMCMEAYADLLTALDAVPEGDGTLLDNCIILACSEVSWGRTHSLSGMPLVLAGGGCGRLRTGWHHRGTGENSSQVLLSILRAMDIPAAEFGLEEGRVTDGLSAIEL